MIFNYTSEYMKELIFELCIYVELSILSPYLITVFVSYNYLFVIRAIFNGTPLGSFSSSYYQIHHSGSAFRMFTFFSPNISATCFFTLRAFLQVCPVWNFQSFSRYPAFCCSVGVGGGGGELSLSFSFTYSLTIVYVSFFKYRGK